MFWKLVSVKDESQKRHMLWFKLDEGAPCFKRWGKLAQVLVIDGKVTLYWMRFVDGDVLDEEMVLAPEADGATYVYSAIGSQIAYQFVDGTAASTSHGISACL